MPLLQQYSSREQNNTSYGRSRSGVSPEEAEPTPAAYVTFGGLQLLHLHRETSSRVAQKQAGVPLPANTLQKFTHSFGDVTKGGDNSYSVVTKPKCLLGFCLWIFEMFC